VSKARFIIVGGAGMSLDTAGRLGFQILKEPRPNTGPRRARIGELLWFRGNFTLLH
jgi:hypothetical protein